MSMSLAGLGFAVAQRVAVDVGEIITTTSSRTEIVQWNLLLLMWTASAESQLQRVILNLKDISLSLLLGECDHSAVILFAPFFRFLLFCRTLCNCSLAGLITRTDWLQMPTEPTGGCDLLLQGTTRMGKTNVWKEATASRSYTSWFIFISIHPTCMNQKMMKWKDWIKRIKQFNSRSFERIFTAEVVCRTCIPLARFRVVF